MSKVIHLETISDLHLLLQQPKAKHPLLSVVDFTQFDEQFGVGLKMFGKLEDALAQDSHLHVCATRIFVVEAESPDFAGF